MWDLTRLFATDAAWDAERNAVLAEIAALRALKDTLSRDAASMREGLDGMSALAQRVQRLWVYACTQSSTASALNGKRFTLRRMERVMVELEKLLG